MNILLSCIGRRGYIADYFRVHLAPGDRIIGTSNSRWTPGFSACDCGVILPDINSPDYVPALMTLCREQNVQTILSFFDPDIDVLAQHLGAFRALGMIPVLPSPEANHICFDKYRSYLFLREHGFSTPETFLDLKQALRAVAGGKVAFPLIVKPRYGFGSHNVFRAANAKELEVFFHYAPEMLVQEMATGQGFGSDILLDLQGQVVSVVPWRKISCRVGETDQSVTTDVPILMELALRLSQQLGRLGHVGPLDVDWILDDDNILVLEMNPRFGGGYPVSHLAGAGFPRLILKMLRGDSLEPQIGQFRPGVIMAKAYNILGGEGPDIFGPILDMRDLAKSGRGVNL